VKIPTGLEFQTLAVDMKTTMSILIV